MPTATSKLCRQMYCPSIGRRFAQTLTPAALLFVVGPACAHERAAPVKEKVRVIRDPGPEEIFPEFPAAADACNDAPVVTVEEIERGVGANERVAIDVMPVASVVCTLLLCGPKDSPGGCCNRCSGGYSVESKRFRLFLMDIGGCEGTDCGWHCEPFGRHPTRRYRFVGFNDFEASPNPKGGLVAWSKLRVEKVCSLPATDEPQ